MIVDLKKNPKNTSTNLIIQFRRNLIDWTKLLERDGGQSLRKINPNMQAWTYFSDFFCKVGWAT